MIDVKTWAWVAGLFEGEGCISFTGKNSVTLCVGMTDRDVIERLRDLLGVGIISEPPKQAHQWKQQFHWKLHRSEEVGVVLRGMLPWLGERRGAKARDALARLAGCRRPGFCKRGHEISGDNLYVSPGGQRQCRACGKFREAARALKT